MIVVIGQDILEFIEILYTYMVCVRFVQPPFLANAHSHFYELIRGTHKRKS
jgi:hypothetical protein